ncbi:MAG TPA: hypothetical protein VKD69_14505 [Vicinamibacterales bacterium]|nr:hypothetical protein [Vicinamibacterales bacterium]
MADDESSKPGTRPADATGVDCDVSIGDVVRAWRRLDARTPDQRRLLAAALGFDYTAPRPRDKPADDTPVATRPTVNDRVPPLVPKPTTPPPPRARPVNVPLKAIGPAEPAPQSTTPAWLRVDRPLEPEGVEHLVAVARHRPLFKPGWTRALVSAACAMPIADGPPDIDRLIERLSNGQPVTEVPRRQSFSLRRGMQLLVDVGENLMPFDRDVRALAHDLLAVVGRDRSRVLYFAGCPTLGAGPAARSSWRPYEAPPPGTPIVLVTDLGIARGAAGRSAVAEATWLAFVMLARAHDCPVVVFNPYPPPRWPAALLRQVRVLQWDRGTTAATAHRVSREHTRA